MGVLGPPLAATRQPNRRLELVVSEESIGDLLVIRNHRAGFLGKPGTFFLNALPRSFDVMLLGIGLSNRHAEHQAAV
jgi:hypothetical protein